MSQENVEIVRRVSVAYNRRDVGAMLDELHPEIEWHPRGAASVRRGSHRVSGAPRRPQGNPRT